MTNSKWYADIETDSIPATKVWFICLKKKGEEEWEVFDTAITFERWLRENQGATVAFHNGSRFDVPQLEQKWGVSFEGLTLVDTLTRSRRSYKNRPGGHSLKAWGERLDFPKDEFTDYDGPATEGEHAGETWDEWFDRNVEYCKQDCRVTEALDKELDNEFEGLSELAKEIEQEVALIIDGQVRTGWLLDVRGCLLLLAELKERQLELEDEVRKVFVPLPTFEKVVTPKVKKDGTFSVVGLKFMGDLWTLVSGPLSRIAYEEFNLGSRKQIARHLQYYGWVPTVYTEPTPNYPNGQVVVDEDTLEGVDIPQAKLIQEYMMVTKRIAAISKWVELADDNDRVHGEVNSNGAVTGRMTHENPNVAQVTSKKKPYGERMRSMWIAKPGYKIVGCDAEGLELRVLAHYMNSESYIQEILSGDVHSANQQAAGLPTRDNAKTFIYAFLYGAGDAKIGSIVGGTKADGKRLKAKFLANTPALKSLRERVEKASRRGWLKGLDGRRLEVRTAYAALNTLLQGAGAIVMKKALILAYNEGKRQGIDFAFVGNIHDELQAEVRQDQAHQFGEIMAQAIVDAGEFFNMRCPMAGKYEVGNSWANTH